MSNDEQSARECNDPDCTNTSDVQVTINADDDTGILHLCDSCACQFLEDTLIENND